MSPIRKVAIVGAAGSLGSVVLDKLTSAGDFQVVVLRRQGSTSVLPPNTTAIDADFQSVDSLTIALRGVDAVVSTIAMASIGAQKTLIDAAIAAGVQRFIPSEFGCDMDNSNAKALPVYAPKIEIQDYLISKASEGAITYTAVYNSAFLDWGIQYDFLLKTSDSKPVIFDGGDTLFSATTLPSVGDAVVGILRQPEETKNRAIRIENIQLSQNKLLELAKKASPERSWQTEHVQLDGLVAKSNERLAQGLLDAETFVPYIHRALLSPNHGSAFEKTDNKLLGIKEIYEEDVLQVLKKHLHK